MRARIFTWAALLGAALAGCQAPTGLLAGSPPPASMPADDPEAGVLYLTDPTYRRAQLEASLVNPDDGYAELRLASYGLAWEELPVWSPRVQPVTTADLGSPDLT